jgi:hypothetical protein
MLLSGIGPSSSRRSAPVSRSGYEAVPQEPRALVPVMEIAPAERPSSFSHRHAAPFLAHLIATARGEPQTCDRRRAAPDTAAQAYAAAARLAEE